MSQNKKRLKEHRKEMRKLRELEKLPLCKSGEEHKRIGCTRNCAGGGGY